MTFEWTAFHNVYDDTFEPIAAEENTLVSKLPAHQIDDHQEREPIKIQLDEVDAFDSVWVKLLRVSKAAAAAGRTEGTRLVSQIGPDGKRHWVGEVLPERRKA